MGISHSALEPEPSVLGHVDSNELLKPVLTCSLLSCCCTLPLKSLRVGLQQEFLSQPSHKEENISTELSKESTRTTHSCSHTLVIFLPPSPPAEVSLGAANSRGGRAVGHVHPGKSPALHSCVLHSNPPFLIKSPYSHIPTLELVVQQLTPGIKE